MDELSRERLGLSRAVERERPVNRWGDTESQILARQAALRRLWKQPKSPGLDGGARVAHPCGELDGEEAA